METSDLLKRVRQIEIKTRGLSNNIFAGQYHSAFKGKGMSFSEVREYQYGDDVRDIDWNVTARYNKPFVKVFEEERELTVMLLIDVSNSLDFGSVKGFIHFKPSEVIPAAEKMNVHLGSLEIQNEAGEKRIINSSAESEAKKITLTYKQSTFSINFSALNFIAPKSIQYAYRMGNMDKEWIPIGERNTVYFAELHPGDYTFEVRAANLSNNWSDTPTRLNITVLPPWWASTPAYASYIVVTLAIIVGFFWSWRRKTKRAMAYNMQLFEDQKEKELYQAKIDFFINIAHEIRTPLTLIKNPLERLLKSDKIGEKENKSLTLMDKNVSPSCHWSTNCWTSAKQR